MRTIMTFVLIIFAIVVKGQADSKTIMGIVTESEKGVPLVGVHISGANASVTMTDEKGEYSIIAKEGDELTFSYLGYETQKVMIGSKSTINIILVSKKQNLAEVTVVGYGVRRKEALTGATSVIRGQDIQDMPSANITGLLQGRVAGVNAGANSTSKINNSTVMIRGVVSGAYNTGSYAKITESKFLSPFNEPLSTFATDVDGASYNNVKRMVKSGQLPPEHAIRIEEMINYFQYDVEGPKNADPINIRTELTNSPWSKHNQLLRITLKAKNVPTEKLPSSNLIFLIDVSGSMSSFNKLPLVKSSYKLLVDQLRPQDKVAIVTYAGNAKVALESTSGDKKMKIKEVIDALQAGGSTAGGDGLKMAYEIARQNFIKTGNNRIIMATDGDFNVGASSDSDMEALIVREQESGVNISVLGYGMGNYKDSKLEILANKGRGNYGYINDISEARKAIINEFGGTMFTVAKDVKIQVEFNPGYVQAYRLIGYENRLMAAEDFNNDNKIGGDMGVGHTVTALYEIVPPGIRSDIVGSVDSLKYQENKKWFFKSKSIDLATVKFRYKDPKEDKSRLKEHIIKPHVMPLEKVSTDFKFITSVAEFGMLLRGSEFKQKADFNNLIRRAREAKGMDDEGYRAEFIRVAEDAQVLMKNNHVVMN